MVIENIKVEDLKPYENNPRNNDEAVQYVANSIKEFGFKVPIVIDKDNVIIAGHTRLKSAELLGLKEVPCIRADDLTDEQVKAFRIADNKVADKSTWDAGLLGEELNLLIDSFDMTDFGFGEFEISMYTEDMQADEYDDDISEYTEKADEFLKAKRCIITYKGEQEEEWLKKQLHQDELKVSYSVEELMRV